MSALQIVLITVVVLVLLKLYFQGTNCSTSRDLTGRVAVVTGGNTGIGKETIRELIKKGCTVYMGARDKKKSEECVKQLNSEVGAERVHYFYLDLSSKHSIKEFADFVMNANKSTKKIDYLLNNAGVMFLPVRQTTKDGFEMQMGINHLGHFYLTYLLWEYLKNSDDLRIVNVSSMGHNINFQFGGARPKLDFDDFNFTKGYHSQVAYSRSKLANVMFSKALARRFEKAGFKTARAVSLHPGAVRTELYRYSMTDWKEMLFKVVMPVYWIFSKSSWQGAQTSLHTIMEQISKLQNGGYYSDCALKAPNPESLNEESQDQLWTISEKLLDIQFNI